MIGVHVCEIRGRVWDTLGLYWDCQESHPEDELSRALVALRGDDAEES